MVHSTSEEKRSRVLETPKKSIPGNLSAQSKKFSNLLEKNHPMVELEEHENQITISKKIQNDRLVTDKMIAALRRNTY